MRDEGWACCYVLVEDRSAVQVAALLGGRVDGPMRSAREASSLLAPWPSVGPAGGAWTVVIDPHMEFGDSDDQLQQRSATTRVVRLVVMEREWFSYTSVWTNGEVTWEASFEAVLDESPCIDSRFPYDPDELARTSGAKQFPDTAYQVPLVAAERLTGWSPRAANEDHRSVFAELVYPRPPEVAAWVAREMGG